MSHAPPRTLPSYPDASLALLTDLYQLTMGYGYWKTGRATQEAVFHLAFRTLPYAGGYAVAAGLDLAIQYLQDLRFTHTDLAWLAEQRGADGEPLFDAGFLAHLAELRFTCDVDAVPEGTVVFPHQPLVRVRGPILSAQLVETALLAIVNYSTLIATKAARVVQAAAGDPVIEGGLRRAQGIDGGVTASRSAYVGGAAGTSNVLAARLYGIPARGTHAHSWVMLHPHEIDSFRAYAAALPNNCTFLVDTYDTLQGVHNAIAVGRELEARGHTLLGVRLDSGDLAWLSIRAREMLDEAGFPAARIVASSDLDEHLVASLKAQGARIDTWLVGTRLVTGGGEGALGGVYKLSAVREEDAWTPRIKLSQDTAKLSIPGVLQVRRFEDAGGRLAGDMTFDVSASPEPASRTIVDPADPLRRKTIPEECTGRDLLLPVFRAGRLMAEREPLATSRERALAEVARLDPSVRRLDNPHRFPAGLEQGLHELRARMALEAAVPPAARETP
jgi:nicotinate phosphoribosyltransferase